MPFDTRPAIGSGGGGTNTFQFVDRDEVTGAAAGSMSVTGISEGDVEFLVLVSLINTSNGNVIVNLNGNLTAVYSHNHMRNVITSLAGVDGLNQSAMRIANIGSANRLVRFQMRLKRFDGQIQMLQQEHHQIDISTGAASYSGGGLANINADIDTITVRMNSGSLDVGSYMNVYKILES